MSVLVYTENWDGQFKKLSFELVSYASKIAEMLSTSVTAVSIGDVQEDELLKLGNYGAKKIISLSDSSLKNLDNQVYTAILAKVVEKEGAQVIVLSHNNTGKALAPRLSVKLSAGLVSGVAALPESTDPMVIAKKVFNGKAYSKVKITTPIKVFTLSQNSFELIESGNQAVIEKISPELDGAPKTNVQEVDKQTGKIILTDAEIVVSGGRGMK